MSENEQINEPDLAPEKTVQFDEIVLGGQPYTELTLREPTAGELEECDGFTGIAWTIRLVAKVSGTPLGVVKKLPVRKMNEAGAYLSAFIAAAR